MCVVRFETDGTVKFLSIECLSTSNRPSTCHPSAVSVILWQWEPLWNASATLRLSVVFVFFSIVRISDRREKTFCLECTSLFRFVEPLMSLKMTNCYYQFRCTTVSLSWNDVCLSFQDRIGWRSGVWPSCANGIFFWQGIFCWWSVPRTAEEWK